MQKLLRFFLMTVLALCFSLPMFSQAEAASIVLLPLINNVANRQDLDQIYFDRAIEAVKKADGVDVADGDNVEKAIAKYTKVGVLPDQAALEAISRDANADYVIGFQVDRVEKVDDTFTDPFNPVAKVYMEGYVVTYNVNTGKFAKQNISDSNETTMSNGARFDIEGELFANAVTRYVKRTLDVHKVSFDKQGFGWKGNRRD